MERIRVQYIEGRKGRITYGVERQPNDDEAYKQFLEKRGLIDIDGKTCYVLVRPEKKPF